MPGEFRPTSIESTRLFERLKKPFNNPATDELAKMLVQTIPTVCRIAVDRMKLMPELHPEFTLHDETHLLRVTELMTKVMPERVIEEVLNPVEIALLILAAHFHDVGMVPDADEVQQIRESQEYKMARENWIINFAGFNEALSIINNTGANTGDFQRSNEVVAEFEQAAFANFIRSTHSIRSSDFVKFHLTHDKTLEIGTGHLADSLALLCASHTDPHEQLSVRRGFLYDKSIGTYQINIAYLATILRLADILDFDRERTPEALFRSISFTNPISIKEWEKHRQVEGWRIDRDAVRFECACEHPEYERSIRQYMRLIDDELAAAHDLIRSFPAPLNNYVLDLPTRTDSSRIKAKDGAYIYVNDLEVSLSRDEIVRLLMTEKLYGHPSLAIRELLQNSWDALRHRRAIMMRDDNTDWKSGNVDFEHGVDEQGREFLLCTDNGVGMDQKIVKDFLVRAGRSYYRSPEFERERMTFLKANADFDPCARFGIGFMSLFMLGDRIIIHTRQYRGSSVGLGEPLIVEINGIGGLIVLRRGDDNQPSGTSIRVIGRRKPERFATWNDQVRLVNTIYAYALAGEFPVSATCSIPEIQDEIKIPAGICEPWHPLLEFNISNKSMFEQEFKEIDSRLTGKIVCGVTLTEDGRLAVANSEAGWHQDERMGASFFVKPAIKFQTFIWNGRTCIDGILVAGPHGRGREHAPLSGSLYPNPIDFGQDLFVLDVRGNLKPNLTPDRAPTKGRGIFDRFDPSWKHLKRIASRAHGRLWEKVIAQFCGNENAEVLWQLLALHYVDFSTMRFGFLWDHLLVPSISPTGELFFRDFPNLENVPFDKGTAIPFATEAEGWRIGITDQMDVWQDSNKSKYVSKSLRVAVITMATVALNNNSLSLEFHPPEHPEDFAFKNIIFDYFERSFLTMNFDRSLDGALAVVGSERILNRKHAVTQYLISKQEIIIENDAEFQFLHCLCGTLLEPGGIEVLASGDYSNRKFNIHLSNLGFYFKNTDLMKLETSLRPPYRCWFQEGKFFEVTEEMLNCITKIQAIDWHKNREPRYI